MITAEFLLGSEINMIELFEMHDQIFIVKVDGIQVEYNKRKCAQTIFKLETKTGPMFHKI